MNPEDVKQTSKQDIIKKIEKATGNKNLIRSVDILVNQDIAKVTVGWGTNIKTHKLPYPVVGIDVSNDATVEIGFDISGD